MDITEVRIFPVGEEKLKAFVSVVFDDSFVVCDVKIIEGPNGRFLSMPSKRRKNGTFRDIAHPLNNATRKLIEDRVFEKYDEVVRERGLEETRSDREATETNIDGTHSSESGFRRCFRGRERRSSVSSRPGRRR